METLMRKSLGIVLLLSLFIVASCGMPGTGPEELNSITAVLRNLPQPQFKLPASLGGESAGISRAVTSTTEVLPVALQNIEDVKSYAWREMSQPNVLYPFVNLAFNKLRNYAEIHTVNAGQVFEFGIAPTEPEMMEIYAPSNLVTDVAMKVDGDETDFTIDMFVDMSYMDGPDLIELPILATLHVYEDTERVIEMSAFFHQEYMGDYMSYRIYMKLGFDSGTGDMAIEMEYYDSVEDVTSTQVYLERSYIEGGAYIKLNKNTGSENVTIGYGDDQLGGIAYLYPSSYWEWDEGLQDWIEYEDGYSVSGEFYDQNGNIIYSMWGETAVRDYGWDGYNIGPNFASAPEFAEVRRRGSYPNYQYFLVDENDAEVEITGFFGYDGSTWRNQSLVWKQADTHFQSGDWIYDWYSSSYDGATGDYVMTLRQYNQVPAGETYFGRTFFIDKEYPLARLLPLTPAYASDYELLEERTTSEEDNDTPGDPDDDWSWTWSDFWLDNLSAGVQGEYDSADIQINNLNSWTSYLWDDSAQDWIETPTAVLITNGDVPVYFTQPDISATHAVRDKLENIYQTRWDAFEVAMYQEQLDAIDPADERFDDLRD
jgi:hypothetical protein